MVFATDLIFRHSIIKCFLIKNFLKIRLDNISHIFIGGRMIHRFIALCSIVFCFSIIAVDFDFYGELGAATWITNRQYVTDDMDYFQNENNEWDSVKVTEDTVPQVYNSMIPVGKFGAKLKSDRFSACIEWNVLKAIHDYADFHVTGTVLPRTEADYFHLRRWFGELHVGEYFSILTGQEYTPANLFMLSNQKFMDNNNFLNTGGMYTGRKPMIQLRFSNSLSDSPFKYDIKIAGIKIDTSAFTIIVDDNPMMNTRLPKFEIGVGFNFDTDIVSILFKLGAGFVNIEYVSTDGPEKKIRNNVQAMLVGFELAGKVGPVKLSFCSHIGQNEGLYGSYWNTNFVSIPTMKIQIVETRLIFFPYGKEEDETGKATGNILNGYSANGGLVLRGEPFEWLGIEAGYSIVRAWHDYNNIKNPNSTAVPYTEAWHNIQAFYANLSFELFDCFKVTPEFGLYDYGPKLWYGRLVYAGMDLRFFF